MSELSEEGQALFDELAQVMTPTAGDEARAFNRLVQGMQAEPSGPRWYGRVVNVARGIGLHLWRIAIPVAVIAGALFVMRAVSRNELGDTAMLESARMLLEQDEHREAYRVLGEHADRFKTRTAAEARTPLVLDALCGMGKRDKAVEYLERHLAAAPDSELAERRRDPCPLGTEPARRLQDPRQE